MQTLQGVSSLLLLEKLFMYKGNVVVYYLIQLNR